MTARFIQCRQRLALKGLYYMIAIGCTERFGHLSRLKRECSLLKFRHHYPSAKESEIPSTYRRTGILTLTASKVFKIRTVLKQCRYGIDLSFFCRRIIRGKSFSQFKYMTSRHISFHLSFIRNFYNMKSIRRILKHRRHLPHRCVISNFFKRIREHTGPNIPHIPKIPCCRSII